VGLGPGDLEYLAPRALAAIQAADTVVGYKSYLKFIQELLVGKEVVSSGMRKEVDRARIAVEMARAGKTVAIVSSGDPGVYGMAGIVIEMAGGEVPVEVIPGITAATSAASVLGAPLMHDFVVISLSDLLTPWETILKRLEAAGSGDFVVVLYNPRSQGREAHIDTARQVLLKYRDPATPVGMVRNARRQGEDAIITTLDALAKEDVDMLTTVIIGNSQTKVMDGKMLTPRGYSI